MTDLIKRAEAVADKMDQYRIPDAQTIRDLIAALRAAPTAEQLRGWAVHAEDGSYLDALADDMRAAADRMEGK